ncbi:MAG: hypothetical protein IJS50_03245, partial [Desulfovibrio sp.]|nr:hypothetical protein [Desulfovibrio sp.]
GDYVIPGSTLKGLLRSTVEILTCSAINNLNNRRIFNRNFNDARYKAIFKIGQERLPQKAGYLVRHGADFEIIPVPYTPVPLGAPTKPGKTRVCTGQIQRKNHDYDFDSYEAHERDPGLAVPDELIDEFILQITPAQEQMLRRYDINGADGIKRMVRPLPIFFMAQGGKLDFFGLARYFRYPNRYSTSELRDKTMPPLPEGQLDFAMQLFGFSLRTGSLSGRVSASTGFFLSKAKVSATPPVVLGRPHPSCFAHYLEQDLGSMRSMPRNPSLWDVNSMHTFNDEATLRGRKCYWHRDPDFPQVTTRNLKGQSILEPIASGAEAEFKIYLERVSLIELGALLEALVLPKGHAHKLGMAKSCGLGSVRLELKESNVEACQDLYSDLEERCLALFGAKAKAGEDGETELFARARTAFQKWLLTSLASKGQNYESYEAIPHIKSFRHMTDFANKPDNSKTSNMDLRDFRALRVLPSPLEIK